ncbi:MAG TPA: hypothetical protein VFZ53_09555 [Polyangiaceae bacterium]
MADDSSDGSDKDRNAATVRDMKGPALGGDTVPEVIGVYAPPRPLPEVSQHRTVDLKSIRLSDLADPRRALTERRLVSPPRPPKASALPWLAGGVAGLGLAAAALWLVLRDSSEVSAPASAPAQRSSASSPAATSSTVEPLGPASEPSELSEPSGSGAPTSTTPVLDASSSPPQKAPRARESTKKRKDPWLE